MSWRNKFLWRWLIRGTCLGLLGLCVGLWGLSCFYTVGILHTYRSFVSVEVGDGVVSARRSLGFISGFMSTAAPPEGWSVYCRDIPHAFSLNLLREDVLGFRVRAGMAGSHPIWHVTVPFWFPTVVFTVVSWVTWRKTVRPKTARGFPIEPLASRGENAGG